MKTGSNKSLNRRLISSSASVVISLSLVLFVVGLLGLVLINAQRLSNYVKENIGFTIMLKEGVNEMEIMKFQKVLDASGFSKSSSFVSKEQATIDLQKDLGEDFVSFLGYSPLLASIDIKLNATYANTDSLAVIKIELSKGTAVHDIFYQENLIDKLNDNVGRLTFFLLSFCLLLFIISFVLINNTIRLSVYSKRFLIRTMRLVGATNSFIQKPFLIKGVYQGIYSSIFAIFMLIGSIQLIQSETASMLNITDLKIISLIFILIFISGFLLSWVSTFFAVRKFINQNESELYN
jgi:cell division transport system permease protein